MANNIPQKFQNDDGSLNADLLLKSYAELEKKIGAMVSLPDDGDSDARKKFFAKIGAPSSPDEYALPPMFADAANVREKFLEIGLTKTQASAVFQLAEEFLAPAFDQLLVASSESEGLAELKEFFGGDEKMLSALKDVDSFAQKNLPADAYDGLCSSAEGVKTIYAMMQSKEPGVHVTGATDDELTEGDLRRLMKDPKYWRDHDDEFVRKIESGFRKVFG